MPIAEMNDAPARRRKYVVPSLARYGTLADLTRANGTKNLNDSPGVGVGCGVGNQFQTSCINPSDVRLKDDIVPLTRLDNGISLYRYRYKWSDQRYVGVMAQEVVDIVPDAVLRGADGYLRVDYGRLGLKLMTWEKWLRNTDDGRPCAAL
jgi:hypothetical protein